MADRRDQRHERARERDRPAAGRSRAAAGRDARSRSAGWSWPASPPPCWKAATGRRSSSCTARRVRGQVDAGDPGPGRDPSRGRPRPARPRRLGGAGRRAGRRPRARVARRADRAHLPSPPALVGHLLGGAIAARFASEPQRPAQPARAGRLARPGRFRPAPRFAARPDPLHGATHRAHARPAVAAVHGRPGRRARADGRALGAVRGLQRRPRARAERRRPRCGP